MSKGREFWEARFIDAFVGKSKRSRYKNLLGDPRSRGKILDRLNHNADLDFGRGNELVGRQAQPEQLIELLSTYKIDAQCWLISDDPELDCKYLPISQAAELTVTAFFGTIMICPPRPIAVFRPEASEQKMYLFS